MSRNIAVLSGKGGVGKTTTTINLGLALTNFGKKTLIIDTNLATPNIGLQLGLPPKITTINDIMRSNIDAHEAICVHNTGLNIIPAGISIEDATTHLAGTYKTLLNGIGDDYDIILMDCGAGLWEDVASSLKAADEAILVTNPEITAVIDSLKALKVTEKVGVNVKGVVINKVKGNKYELTDKTIKKVLKEGKILAKIPYDNTVPESIAMKEPIVVYKPHSKAAHAYKQLAAKLTGIKYEESTLQKVADFLYIGNFLNGDLKKDYK